MAEPSSDRTDRITEEELAGSSSCGKSLGRGERLASWLAAGVYLAAAGWLALVARNQINPDGVAYIQIARHYAHGRFDLAVASHWGPLLSWLLVPAVWMGLDPLLSVKVLQVLLGLGYALAVGCLVRRFNDGRGFFLGFAASAVLALTMVPDPVTPDLLLAVLVNLYLLKSLPLIWQGSWRPALGAGMLGGVGYLAKHYALPFVSAHLTVTFLLRAVLVRKGQATGPVMRPFLAAVAGLMVIVLPWAAVISISDGTLTFAPTGERARSFSPLTFRIPSPIHLLQRPRAGRLTSWENPSENPYEWPTWSPLAGWQGLRDQVQVTYILAGRALGYLRHPDALAILLSAYFWALVVLVAGGRWLRPGEGAGIFWVWVSFALYVGGYLLVYVEERYLWAALGMLVALAIRLAWLLVRPAGGGGQGPTRAGKRRAAAWWVFGLCLLASLGHRAALSACAWSGPQGNGAFYNWLRTASGQLPAGGQAAANEWHRGLFAAYWAGCPYLGQFRSHSPEGVAGELADYGATTVLVFQDDDLAGELRASPLFREEGSASSPTGPWSLAIFQFIPQPASAP